MQLDKKKAMVAAGAVAAGTAALWGFWKLVTPKKDPALTAFLEAEIPLHQAKDKRLDEFLGSESRVKDKVAAWSRGEFQSDLDPIDMTAFGAYIVETAIPRQPPYFQVRQMFEYLICLVTNHDQEAAEITAVNSATDLIDEKVFDSFFEQRKTSHPNGYLYQLLPDALRYFEIVTHMMNTQITAEMELQLLGELSMVLLSVSTQVMLMTGPGETQERESWAGRKLSARQHRQLIPTLAHLACLAFSAIVSIPHNGTTGFISIIGITALVSMYGVTASAAPSPEPSESDHADDAPFAVLPSKLASLISKLPEFAEAAEEVVAVFPEDMRPHLPTTDAAGVAKATAVWSKAFRNAPIALASFEIALAKIQAGEEL